MLGPSPRATIASTATIIPMTQPRTVLNLTHSARSSCANPSCPACTPGRYVMAVIAPPAPSARNSTASWVSCR